MGERGRSEQYKITDHSPKKSDLADVMEALTGQFGMRNIDMFLKSLEFTFERLADYIDTFGSVTLRSRVDAD